MKFFLLLRSYLISFCIFQILTLTQSVKTIAQCTTLSGPSYSNTCSTDYFTSISASGSGVTSTISYPYASCTGTYFNYYSTQGASAASGTTVSVPVNRCLSTYTAYTSIWIDWNNDNTYQTSEEVAGPHTYVGGATAYTFSFTVPSTGVVSGTHLHMRVYMGEAGTAPCTATYGETADYFFQVNCSSLPTITTSPTSGSFCAGSSGVSITASGAGGGGTYSWTPSSGLSATTGATVTATPTVTTVYTVTGTTSGGCSNTTTVAVTVNPLPSAITGSLGVCTSGGTTTLSDATSGGTWSTSSSNITLGSTGVVTGVTTGTAVVTYTAGGCSVTTTVTVNPLPVISGTLSDCSGSTTTLSSTITGSTWSSSNTAIATVGSSSGIVTGVTTGTCTIICVGGGCSASVTVTINPLPASITGTLTVCPGNTTTLSDATTGGSWSTTSSNITIGSGTGMVTGVTAGTAVVTYTSSLGCNALATVTVNPSPASVSGSLNVCISSTATLTDGTSGGLWSCSNSNISIGSSSGLVTGLALGTSVVTYTLGTGCYVTAVETVNAFPSAISGSPNLCVGISTTFTDATTGGIWSASNSNVTAGSSTGIITGVSTGTSVISYTTGSGCYVTYSVTVNPAPAAISGLSSICVGASSFLFETTSGGAWSSSNSNVSIGSSTGFFTGIAVGTSVLSYTLGTGCYALFPITVDPIPASITGTLNVCIGQTTTLGDGTSGGTWSLSNSNATIGSSSGIVTGITAGTSVVTYTLSTGCFNTAVVTINGLPSSISGSSSVCVGSSTTFTDATTGGIWTSSNSNATVGSSSGSVTGVTSGSSVITYILSTGCFTTTPVTINPLPLSISGTLQVCPGGTTTLADVTTGGTWTSSNANATIGSSSGMATGVTSGTSIITYTISTGCFITAVLTINPLPAIISGPSQVCMGSNITLTDATAGGYWSISNAHATIGTSTGVVTGISAGTSVITYTLPTGCYTTTLVTINTLPALISGTLNVCVGSSTLLGDITTGGTWSISNAHASIGSSTGFVTGISTGTSIVTYTSALGCFTTSILTVNPLPANVSGPLSVCVGQSVTVSDGTGGGIWSISNSNATIGSVSGLVTGVTAGTSVVTYTLATGCYITAVFTINPLPSAITGPFEVCLGSSVTETDPTSGGTWTISNTHASIVSVSGVMTGITTGTAVITYIISTGCYITAPVTVDPLPALISGTLSACAVSAVTVSDIIPGGTWSASNSNVTIGSGSGLVTGVNAGTSVISYTLATGCYSTAVFTVNPLPAAIAGPTVVCVGSTSTLTDALTGGTWTISNTNAGITPLTGVVSGLTAGTSVVTYTLSTGCQATIPITINSLPSPIAGGSDVCIGSTITLTDPGGGLWTSSNTHVSVGYLSGVATGVSLGTSIITYALGSGCVVMDTITVHPLPSPVSGPSLVCVGSTINLTDPSSGGVWTSSNTNASAGSSSGVVGGISSGTSLITYTSGAGCYATYPVTVNPLPSIITGPSTLCPGTTINLSDSTTGGSWGNSNANVSIGVSTGIVTGIATGTTVITYLLGTGCYVTRTITINPLPSAVSGTSTVCVGLTTTLTDAGGGSWASSNLLIASIGSSTGVVTGVSVGPVVITYILPTGCPATFNMTVNPLPAVITGSTTICLGASAPLSDVGGGTWGSSNPSIASIGSLTGIVTGAAIGSATITYTIATGCYRTTTVNIISLPSPISGPSAVCAGSTLILSDPGGGIWSASNANITVGSLSGIVTGVTAGTSVVTYTLGTGCSVVHPVTIDPAPTPISGITSICLGNTTTLSDGITGGSWISGSPLTVSIGSSSGLITGLAAGIAVISYSVGIGCDAMVTVTVNSVPAPIGGTSSVCVGNTATLTDPGGGLWSVNTTTVATIGSSSGVITGIAPGIDTVTYTLGSGCLAKKTISVNPLPLGFTGSGNICLGNSAAFADSMPGGSWSSGNPLIAGVGVLTGTVTGVSAGVTNIIYTLPTGCSVSRPVTVNPLPLPITGTFVLCQGSNTLLSDPIPGGNWSSSNSSVATIGSGSGLVSGISGGSAVITYTSGSGCIKTATVTVNPLPAIPNGSSGICIGSSSLLTDSTASGLWSSSNTGIAPVGSSTGLVSGIALGLAVITYTLPTGCYRASPVTVNPLPTAILGATSVCAGGASILSDPITGGTWTSADTTIAFAGYSSGIITGLSVGATIITYTLSIGCYRTTPFTVIPSPSAIIGSGAVCVGSSIALTDTSSGGVWSSGSTSIAIIGSGTGVVHGLNSGTAIISYTSTTTGCSALKPVNVNPILPVLGPSSVCVGFTAIYTDAAPGGSWSSSAPAIGSINPAGVLTGLATGTTTVDYTLPTGCSATYPVTVNAIPPVITGANHVCVGQNITLSDALPGGGWISSNPALGSIDPLSGVLVGISAGVVTISYSFLGCPRTLTVTINPLPGTISGSMAICQGTSTTLSNPSAGGTWLSSSPSVASIGSSSGFVSGLSAGTSTITYTLGTGCYITASETVIVLPAPIAGPVNICIGAAVLLTDATPGGLWSSSNTAIAPVGAFTGSVLGLAVGAAVITYTAPTGCQITNAVTVNPLPLPVTGATQLCVGATSLWSDASPGGIWSSNLTSVAIIGSSTGLITGITPGTDTIYYSISSTGCISSSVITINPLPVTIAGVNNLCTGFTTTFTDATPGGSWSSSDTTIATIDSGTGLISGISGGTVTLTYTLATGCMASRLLTVYPVPAAITGSTQVCLDGTSALHDSVPGGHWYSSNPSVATVDSNSGIVSGVSLGTDVITYSFNAACATSVTVTVNPLPVIYTVTGGGTYCADGTGEHIGLSGSAVGVNYFLYRGITATGSFAGTGAALDFGLQTVMGTYTVIATTSATGCSNNMAGTAIINITPHVVPLVSLNLTPGDTVCSGTTVSYNPVVINGGSSPVYQWIVNGTNVATTNSYIYIPANGDVVMVTITSNAVCALPLTASHSVTAVVNPFGTPYVSITATPNDTVCKGSLVTLIPVSHYGGSTPVYTWFINGVNEGSSGSYSYVPVNNDQVYCIIRSNYLCRLNNTDTSATMVLYTDTPVVPQVNISAYPSTLTSEGQPVTLTASVINGGLSPTYQWVINSIPVTGATNAIYTRDSFAAPYDSVSCLVTNHDLCTATGFTWVFINVAPAGIYNLSSLNSLTIVPNPGSGDFVLKGSTGIVSGTDVNIVITDLSGQVIYYRSFRTLNSTINEKIDLGTDISSGTYIMKVITSSDHNVFHIVIEK